MYRQYLVQWPTRMAPMWFERFKKDFRRRLAYYQAEERLRNLFRTKHSVDGDPNVVSHTSPPWWRRIFRRKADGVIEITSETLPPSTPEELKTLFIEQFELPESAKDMSLTDVMIEVTKQMSADRGRMESTAREIRLSDLDDVKLTDPGPQDVLRITHHDPTQPPPGPVPFGKASECPSCGSKHITGHFVENGFKNHCHFCGLTWIGEWPDPVITVPPKADVTYPSALDSIRAGVPPGVIVFQIASGPGLEERATKALAAINGRREEGLRHHGHWEAFYYHDDVCPSRDKPKKCTCGEFHVECHPISDSKAADLRADDTQYDDHTVMEIE